MFGEKTKFWARGGRVATPKAMKYKKIIEEAAEMSGVPLRILLATIYRESKFNWKAVSEKGARGLTQLMPNLRQDIWRSIRGVREVKDDEAKGWKRHFWVFKCTTKKIKVNGKWVKKGIVPKSGRVYCEKKQKHYKQLSKTDFDALDAPGYNSNISPGPSVRIGAMALAFLHDVGLRKDRYKTVGNWERSLCYYNAGRKMQCKDYATGILKMANLP